MASKFSAGPQALGYLYQARYALFLALSRSPEFQISIEGIDDVAFEDNGEPKELLQLKHHVHPENLTDGSSDLWKTLRVWSTALANGDIDVRDTILSIVTTATASEGSGVAALRANTSRTPETALKAFKEFALNSTNTALGPSFRAFLSLSDIEREQLVNAIHVIDGSPNITDMTDKILQLLLLSVRPRYLQNMYERLEGWWFGKVIDILACGDDSLNVIPCYDVHSKIHQIRDYFQPDALPIDEIEIGNVDASNDSRAFVAQLTQIGINTRRIEKAIIDHDRAYSQRSRWVRERLLLDDECQKYEVRLVDEWERQKYALEDDYDLQASEQDGDLQRVGQLIYRWVDREADIRIRPNVVEEYIMRGSYHMLADRYPPLVWWHPKFKEIIEQKKSSQ